MLSSCRTDVGAVDGNLCCLSWAGLLVRKQEAKESAAFVRFVFECFPTITVLYKQNIYLEKKLFGGDRRFSSSKSCRQFFSRWLQREETHVHTNTHSEKSYKRLKFDFTSIRSPPAPTVVHVQKRSPCSVGFF